MSAIRRNKNLILLGVTMREFTTNDAAKTPIGLLVAGAMLLAAIALNNLADWLGVDLNSALVFVLGMSLTLLILGVGLCCQINESWSLTLSNTAPLALWTFILGMSPVLQRHGTVGPWFAEIYLWWGNPIVHHSLAWLILIAGYGFLFIRRER